MTQNKYEIAHLRGAADTIRDLAQEAEKDNIIPTAYELLEIIYNKLEELQKNDD